MIQYHHLHLQWKFKFLAGKFTWGIKTKHCWVMLTNFLFSKVWWQCPGMVCLYAASKLSARNLNFHWRWRWWDQIQATFLNLLYFRISSGKTRNWRNIVMDKKSTSKHLRVHHVRRRLMWNYRKLSPFIYLRHYCKVCYLLARLARKVSHNVRLGQ